MALESEVEVLKSVVSKLDTSIDKIAQVSQDIGKILAVHDQRLDNIEKVSERRNDEIRDLHSRITTGNREIVEKIEELEDRLEKKMKENGEAATKQHKDIQQEIQKDIESIASGLEKLENRTEALERWKWYVIGAVATIGYLLGHLEWLGNLAGK